MPRFRSVLRFGHTCFFCSLSPVSRRENNTTRTHLTSPLHQVHHAVKLVDGAQPRRRPVEPESPPRGTVSVLAPEMDNLDHDRSRVLGAHRGPLSLIAPARYIRASLLGAPQALQHVDGVRRVGLASPRIVHGSLPWLGFRLLLLLPQSPSERAEAPSFFAALPFSVFDRERGGNKTPTDVYV